MTDLHVAVNEEPHERPAVSTHDTKNQVLKVMHPVNKVSKERASEFDKRSSVEHTANDASTLKFAQCQQTRATAQLSDSKGAIQKLTCTG